MVEQTSSIDGPSKPVFVNDPVSAGHIEFRDSKEFVAEFGRRHGKGYVNFQSGVFVFFKRWGQGP
jgi:hypothetical protein